MSQRTKIRLYAARILTNGSWNHPEISDLNPKHPIQRHKDISDHIVTEWDEEATHHLNVNRKYFREGNDDICGAAFISSSWIIYKTPLKGVFKKVRFFEGGGGVWERANPAYNNRTFSYLEANIGEGSENDQNRANELFECSLWFYYSITFIHVSSSLMLLVHNYVIFDFCRRTRNEETLMLNMWLWNNWTGRYVGVVHVSSFIVQLSHSPLVHHLQISTTNIVGWTAHYFIHDIIGQNTRNVIMASTALTKGTCFESRVEFGWQKASLKTLNVDEPFYLIPFHVSIL